MTGITFPLSNDAHPATRAASGSVYPRSVRQTSPRRHPAPAVRAAFSRIGHGHLSQMIDAWQPRVLREYSFIADGERGAVIGPDGAIVWLCMPTWDGQAVFSALLGGQGGYAITPADPRYVWGGYYEPGSLIWRSRWVTSALTECREALAMPADPHRCVLLRRVQARRGPARLRVVLDLRSAFAGGR